VPPWLRCCRRRSRQPRLPPSWRPRRRAV